jgi:hypothetical protein
VNIATKYTPYIFDTEPKESADTLKTHGGLHETHLGTRCKWHCPILFYDELHQVVYLDETYKTQSASRRNNEWIYESPEVSWSASKVNLVVYITGSRCINLEDIRSSRVGSLRLVYK